MLLIARMLCSDQECAQELEILVQEIDELDRLNCDCGYGLVVTSVSQVGVLHTHKVSLVSALAGN